MAQRFGPLKREMRKKLKEMLGTAHRFQFLDSLTEMSLAARVCSGDSSVELSGKQAEAHEMIMVTTAFICICV